MANRRGRQPESQVFATDTTYVEVVGDDQEAERRQPRDGRRRPVNKGGPYRVVRDEQPRSADLAAVRDGLTTFNRRHVGDDQYQSLAIFLRDAEGGVAGGLLGSTFSGWLYVNWLWVAEEVRGQGYGTRLLEEAEREAIRRGCEGAFLDTHDFQAPAFYQARGYDIFGELRDFPRGHSRFFLRKRLVASGITDSDEEPEQGS